MTAWYNEIDPFAAAWLRELIKAGHIADGIVDERSIEDVKPDEIREFTQCHFFAGIGVWSYALRRAGWSDDTPVWTGSCPCQPFSAAGKGGGFDDERHLWPSWYWLIEQCEPSVILGEQVASKATNPWFDLVQSDLEGLGYAFGVVPFPSAGVGAPMLRDRAFWLGSADSARLEGYARNDSDTERQSAGRPVAEAGVSGGMANTKTSFRGRTRDEENNGRRVTKTGGSGTTDSTGPTNGFWRDVDWLGCRDGKFRPVEPGTFPLVDGPAARMGRLRGYGNAINAEAATIFTEEVMGVIGVPPVLTKESLI